MKCHKNVITPLPSPAQPGSSSQTRPTLTPPTQPTPTPSSVNIFKHTLICMYVCVGQRWGFEHRGVGVWWWWWGFQLVVFLAFGYPRLHGAAGWLTIIPSPSSSPAAPEGRTGRLQHFWQTFGSDFNCESAGSYREWGPVGCCTAPRTTSAG